ncbi:MAG: hypothetical protein FWB87_04235 [Defluviitaleaceae bacterium]|nr:hypothetical protein [Defluviitaleaceae bacterium]
MDICSFINSTDVAEHCRKIGHIFNSLEMAVVIAISEKPTKEKHEAWKAIISDYPDMPIPESHSFEARESLHMFLQEQIAWEEKEIANFYESTPNAVYRPCVRWYGKYGSHEIVPVYNMGCFSTVEKAWEKICDKWDFDVDRIYSISITKEYTDDHNVEALFSEKREFLHFNHFPIGCPGELDMIFIHIPLPFKKGDLLEHEGIPFILDNLPHWSENRGLSYEEILSGEHTDGSDMSGWGLYATEDGYVYGNHTALYYGFSYFKGKLRNNEYILHYVNLFMKGEIALTELLTMQCRIVMEHTLDDVLLKQSHGCYLPDNLLAENRVVEK